jgi:hypothetical protein
MECSRGIWIRKYRIKIVYETERLIRKDDIAEIEQRTRKMNVEVDNPEERNDLFH